MSSTATTPVPGAPEPSAPEPRAASVVGGAGSGGDAAGSGVVGRGALGSGAAARGTVGSRSGPSGVPAPVSAAVRVGFWRTAGRRGAYGLGLLPASAGVMTAVAVSGPAGGVDAARRHLDCGGFVSDSKLDDRMRDDRVRGARVMVHGLLGVVFGLLFWWLTWMALLATARGPFYGFVVPGPYDDAWGGPNLVGAWATHGWAWVGVLVVLALVWWGLAGLHVLLTEFVVGTRRRPWVPPVAGVVVLGAVLLVVGWVQQI